MIITFPDNTAEVIDAIRGAIGREVEFVTEIHEDCYNCEIDPVTGNSTNSFCTVCSGTGYITTFSGFTTSGHITWGHAEGLGWVTGGQIFDGDCRVQVAYLPEIESVIEGCSYVNVDGRKMDVRKIIPRGVKQLNRILVELIERDKDAG